MRRLAILPFVAYIAAIILAVLGAPPRAQAVTTVGTSGNDTLVGTNDADELSGLAGRDELRGRGGPDVLSGGDGSDHLLPGKGADEVDAGRGNDVVDAAGGGIDRVRCGRGRFDVAIVDWTDVLLGGCEVVFHPDQS